MAWIDSLLGIVNERGADELRVVAGHGPQMFAAGSPKRLAIPAMTERDVRDLLGELLSEERLSTIAAGHSVELVHQSKAHGTFQVTLGGEGGLSATFVKGATPRAAAPVPPIAEREPLRAAPAPVSASTTTEHGPDLARERFESPLVVDAARLGASDLHLAEGEVAQVRVDGVLRQLSSSVIKDVPAVLSLSQERRDVLVGQGSLDYSATVLGAGVVRVHVFRTANGAAAAVRLLPGAAPSLAALGMPVALDDLVLLPHGLVVVAGPAGSGKSTTLAALAQEALKRRSIVLVTLEDPSEYGLSAPTASLVRRRQVGRDVPTFAAGLRDALREDPDVLLVGEMRDPETIALALTAAETGHLVLGSIHSRSAASAVQRIFDAYPPERQPHIRTQLAEALSAVVSQRLLPRARGDGRVPVVEVLRATTAVANTVREGRTASLASLMQSGRRDGMISLERCLSDRVRAGDVRLEDARAVAFDQQTLTTYLSD